MLIPTYERIVEAAPQAMMVVDREGRIVVANAQAHQLFGYGRGELVGELASRLVPTWLIPDSLKEAVAAKRTSSISCASTGLCGVTKIGEKLSIELTLTPIETEQGLFVLASVVDICERQRQQVLQETYRLMVEAAPSAMILVDENGQIDLVNGQAETLFGYMREELIGMPLEILLPAEHRQRHVGLRRSFLQSPSARLMGFGGDLSGLTKDGRQVPVEIGLSPITTSRGMQVIATIADVTQRRRAEDDLRNARDVAEAATRAKAVFLSTMSHEIRTPMNAIIGMTSVLLESNLTLEQLDWTKTIRGSGEHLLTVINDILDFSKIEAGKIELECHPCSVQECVKSALDLMRVQADKKRIEIGFLIDTSVPEGIHGDVARLRQVLLNLISNAVKFTPPQGQVIVSVSAAPLGDAYRILFSVRDTGIGLSPAQQEKLFQPFSQADAATARTYGGTGLGLSISKRLAELMGGCIWVESQPGQGATFSFTIVAAAAPAVPIAADSGDTATTGGFDARFDLAASHPLRILVAEDHPVNQQIFQLLFKQMGYHPDFAADGAEALAAVYRQPYDVVFMDVRMPVMDGLEATRLLCERWPAAQRPRIVGLSADAMTDDRKAGMRAGMVEYLSKPVTAEALRQTIARCRRIGRDAYFDNKGIDNALPPLDRGHGRPTAGPTSINEQIFQRLVLLVSHETGADTLVKLVRDFLSNAAAHVNSVAAACVSGDVQSVQLASHSLKSSAAMFGALDLSRRSANLEQLAKDGDIQSQPTVAQEIAGLQKALEEVRWAFGNRFPILAQETRRRRTVPGEAGG